MATEKRLIDANDAEKFAREHILDAKERFLILDFLRECPTVDAVEVVHGRWISEVVRKPDWKGKMRDYYQAASCSVCHNPDPGHGTSNYCPNCGAKMDQERRTQ